MINVDISNIWGEASLPDLLGLEAEVFAAHAALSEGTGAGSEFRGWQDLPAEEATEEILRILSCAGRIRGNSDVLVVIGIGGSTLGARGVIELLQGPSRNIGKAKPDPQILYAGDSLSTRHWNGLLRLLEGKDFSLCVISESGDELEPGIAFRNLRWILERRYGTDEARKRICAVAVGAENPLRQGAREEGWECFTVPENVGQRFALLSPAGLLPMAVAGIDITAVLRGAGRAKEEYDLRSYENPVWLYAAVRNLMYRKGKSIELLETFEPGFGSLGLWWQRLFAGAEGQDGKGLFPATAELTAGINGLGTLAVQGQRNLFETMLRFAPPQQKTVVGEDIRDWDGLNPIAGKTLDHVEEAAYQALLDIRVEKDVPVIGIECEECGEETLGELIYFLQLSCAISAYMLGVNPFDMTGMQTYQEKLQDML